MNNTSENKLMRRVQGFHDYRLDGVGDILCRARDASVFDIGCSRGQVGEDFRRNGATVLHGCDIDPKSVEHAAGWFYDHRGIQSKFEVVDLTKGPSAVEAVFGKQKYDIVVMLAVYHKINRQMKEPDLTELVKHFGERTNKWFVWRGTSDKRDENEQEMRCLDRDLGSVGLKRCHTSYLSLQLDLAAIWRRS